MAPIRLAVQLYTLRDLCRRNFLDTLDRVARLGCSAVELAGTFGIPPDTIRRHADGLGLQICSAHVPIEELEDDLGQVVDVYTALGAACIVCPWWPVHRRLTGESWFQTARLLDHLGDKLATRGLALCYHNHDFELRPVDHQFALEALLKHTEPASLQFELDCYWIRFADQDPVEWIHRCAGRLPLLHLKDMAPGPERRFAPVGSGLLDWPAILDAARAAGVHWAVVEQDDTYDQPPLEALRSSLDHLHHLGLT